MAIIRFALTHRTRVRGSKSATDVVQYLTREGRHGVFPEDDLRYLTRTSEATQERGDLRHVETGNLPAWAQGDPTSFFEAAYQYEGVNRRYATALQMALPRELTHEQHLALARDFMATHLQDKPYIWVKHEPMAKDGQPQPHIHILCSTRMEDGIERGPQQYFKRWDRRQPERGGARKDPFWNERRAVGQLRESWAILTNVHLERAGQEARVDPRELAVRGIERRPGTKWQRSPEPHDFAKEQAAAVQWWEETKRELRKVEHGHNRADTNTHDRADRDRDLSRGTSMAADPLIEIVRTHARQGGPGHYPSREELTHERDQAVQRGRVIEAELSIVTRALERKQPVRLVQRGRAQDDYVRGGGLRVRLTEEKDYERGW